jgi:dihydroceramide fatty acyl 2-hydroxylase
MSTTRANARAGLAADVLVSCVLLYLGLRRTDLTPALAISIALFGLVLFSFVEYCFHRWLFHGSVHVLEQGHRKHHEEPQAYDSLPFFLPPLVALLLAGVLSVALPASSALVVHRRHGSRLRRLRPDPHDFPCGALPPGRWPGAGRPRITFTTITRTATSA